MTAGVIRSNGKGIQTTGCALHSSPPLPRLARLASLLSLPVRDLHVLIFVFHFGFDVFSPVDACLSMWQS